MQTGVDFSQATIISALSEGVAVSLSELENGYAGNAADAELNIAYNTACDYCGGAGFANWAGFEVVACDEGLSVADGEINVTRDGAVTLSDGVSTIYIVISNYSRLVSEIVGEAITIAPVSETAALPEGVAVFEEKADEAVFFRIAEMKGGQTLTMAASEDTEEVEVRTLYMQLFDIGIVNANGAVEPGFDVSVQADFAAPIEGQDFELYHILDGQPVLIEDGVVVEDGRATGLDFVTGSFSDYAVVWYTVDFGYNGSTFSLDGGSTVALVDILHELGIDIENNEIEYARFTNGDVVEVFCAAEDYPDIHGNVAFTAGTWIFRSLIPFSSHERLTVKAADGAVYIIVVTDDSTPMNLLNLTGNGNIHVTVATAANQNGNYNRTDTLALSFQFMIPGGNVTTAKNNYPWVYDLSGLVDSDSSKYFTEIADEAQGILIDGDNVAGHYVVSDGKVYIYPDLDYIARYNESLSGSFTIQVTLNEVRNADKDKDTFTFPGDASVEVTYEAKKLSHTKKVGGSEFGMANASSNTISGNTTTTNYGSVTVQENENGDYTLFYQIDMTPNQKFQSLTVADTLSGGQTLNTDSIKVYDNGTLIDPQNYTSSANGSGFNINLTNVQPWRPYRVTYSATVPKAYLNIEQTNTANYTYDGKNETDITKETPTFHEELQHGKLTGLTADSIYSGGGNINMEADQNGKYYLYWKIRVRPNTNLNSLKVTDTISQGLTLDTGSFALLINGVPSGISLNPTTTDNGFVINDLAALLPDGKVAANTEYQIVYRTEVNADYVANKTQVTNTAAYKWSGTSTPDTDTVIVTPQVPDPVYPIGKAASLGSAKPGDKITYTIKLPKDGDNAVNRAGHTITDYISAAIAPQYVGAIAVTGSNGADITSRLTISEAQSVPANQDPYPVFTVTFPNNAIYNDEYTITYTVTVPDDASQIGKLYIHNDAWDGNSSHDGTTTVVDYGDLELEKHFDHFDDATNETVWKLRVTVPAGKTVSNVVVHERDFAGSDYIYYLGTAHSINWDKLSVVGVDGTDMTNQYTVDAANNDITFASLSRSVEITLVTTSPVPFNNYEAYYVQNCADLKVGDKGVDTASDRATHAKADYGFEKDGTFDAETGITTWTVDINPRNNSFSPDFVPYFEDHIPAGMELVGNTISVSVNGNGNPNRYGQIIWQIANDSLAVDASDGDIGLINLPDAVNYEKVWGYGGNSPTGLSGMHYRITYQTRLTDAERAKVEGVPGAYAYTNRARVTDSDGKILKTTNDTVEYEYDHLIEKFDMTDTNAAGHIDYRVIVNENERNLNGGPGHYIELTDVISTDVSLLINTVKVYSTAPENGDTELAGVTIGYNDNSRTLQIYIPDGHYARVEYSVKPNRSGITFTNKAVLKGGNITVSDEVQKFHNVTSGGTLTGTDNSITLYKFDQYNLRKPLQGAKFELYKCTTDPTTHRITGANRVLNTETNDYSFTTDEFGDAVFPINEQNTLYYWVETEAPAGYMLLDQNPHYFVTYKQYDTNTIKDQYPGHPAIAFSALPESVKNELRTAHMDWDFEHNEYDTRPDATVLLFDAPYSAELTVELSASQLNRTVTHVNKTVQEQAWALDDQVQAANGIKIASLIDGYIWRYGNVEETVKVRLNGVKQMVGRDMAAGEFNFDLYDNTDPAAPNWIETAKNIPGTDGQYTEFGFNEIAYVKPGTYHYLISEVPGGTRDTSVIYDNTRYQVTVIVESVPIEDSVEEDVVNGLRIASVTYCRNGEGVHLPAGTVVRKQDGSTYTTYTVGEDGKNTALFINKEDKASLAVSKTFSGSYLNGMTEQEIAALKNAVTFEVYEGTTLIKSFTYADMLAGQMTLTAADGIETGHSYTVKEVLNAQAAPADARVLTTYAMNGTPGEGTDVNVQMADSAIQLDYNNDYEPLTTELHVVKKWYINETKTTLTNDEFEQQTYTEAPAGISQIAFWLQKRVDDASGNALSAEALENYAYNDGVSPRKAYEVGWEYFGGQGNIYFVKASKNWSAMITDLPVGTYRIIEIERVTEGTTIDTTYDNTVTINGSTWRPVNAGNLFYSVGVVQDADAMDYDHGTVNSQYTNNNTPEKIHFWAGSGTQDAAPGHELVVADKIVRIEFVKAWKDQEGTASTMADLNVASLTLRLQSNTADLETGWVNTDKTVTIIPNHETIRFDVSQKDANGHGLYYRVVETSMTLNDGTVLNEAQIRERFDAAFTPVIGRYVSHHNHMYPLDGGNFKQDLDNDGTADSNDPHNGRQQTLTNTEKPSGIRVTKRFVELDDTTTDTTKVYFKVKVRPRGSSTWADMVSTNVTAINEGTKETVSPDGNNVFAIEYDNTANAWPTLRFDYILRARSANGTIPAEATDSWRGIIDEIKFVETNASGSEAANANYVVSYAYDGTGGDASGLSPDACGIFTITNTRRTPTKLNVTKKYLGVAGNNVAQEGDRIYFRVVLNGKGEWTTHTCTMPNNGGVNTADINASSTNVHYSANSCAYYIEYKDGSWETANFVLPTTFDTNNASDDQLLTGVYAYECDQYGNTEQEPKPHLYHSGGTEATLSNYLIDYTLDISGNKLQDIGPNNMVPASTESTLTITNLPEAATIIPTVDKQWLFGNDTTPTSNWPGKVSAVTVQLYRYISGDETSQQNPEKVGEPVIINAATALPYAFHRQYKYDDQAREYVYFAKEEKIRLLDSGSVVDVDLTATNPYLDASSTNSLLINHTDEEECVTIRVTKKWRTPDNHDKIWDEGQTITFTVKQNGKDVAVDQAHVANATVNPDNTVTLTGTATGWPVAELTLPKYIDGRPASYYVTEDPFDGAHPATSETGYYEISYQLNGQTRPSDSAAACSGGTITLVNRDIRRSSVKVTKRWLAADGTTDIGSSVAIDHVTFKVMYRYKKTMTSNEQVDYENGGTYGTYTIHRQPDGKWEVVTLPVLPKDPDYKSDANTTYEAQYYIVEVDGSNVDRKHGTFPVFDGVTYDSLTVLKGDNSVNDDQNGHGFDYNADDTITLTNKLKADSGKVEVYKRWAMDGADITALKDDTFSATVQLRQKLDNTQPASLVIYSDWQTIAAQYDNFQIGDTVRVIVTGTNQPNWEVNDVSHPATHTGENVFEMDVLLTSDQTKLEIYGVTEGMISVAKTGGSTSDILVQDNILLNRDNNWHQSITASGDGYYIKETDTAGIDPADIVSKTYAANGTTYTFNGDVPSGGVSGGGVGDNAPTADKATVRLTAGAAADVTITITNSYDDDFAFDIDVDKSWVDENFEEVAWPGPVTIELWESVDGGDMENTGRTITLTGDHTSDVFENVGAHRYINGKYVDVEYAIHETDSANLIAITGDAANSYHVINTTAPGLYITKAWFASDGTTEITSDKKAIYFKVGSKNSWDANFTYGDTRQISKKADGTWSTVRLDPSLLNDENKTYCIKEVNQDGSDISDCNVTYTLNGAPVPASGFGKDETGLLTIRNSTPEKKGDIEVVKKWEGDFTNAEKTAYVQLKKVKKENANDAIVYLYENVEWKDGVRNDNTQMFEGKTANTTIQMYSDEPIHIGDRITLSGLHSGGKVFDEYIGANNVVYGNNNNNKLTFTVAANEVKLFVQNSSYASVDSIERATAPEPQGDTGNSEPQNPVLLEANNNWYYKWENLSRNYTYFVEEVFPLGTNPETYTNTIPNSLAVTVSSKDGVVDQSHTVEKGLITVTNTKQYGGLKLTKIVSVNDTPATAESNAALKALVDGVYTFKLSHRTAADQSLTDLNTTIAITIANGAVASATKQTGNDAATPLTVDENGFVVLDHLEVGDYKIEEQPTTNGTVLSNVSVSAGSTGDNYAMLTVTGNNTATMPTATFTNNKPTAGSLKLMKHVVTTDGVADNNGHTYFFTLQPLNANGQPRNVEPKYIKLWVTNNQVDDWRLMTKGAYDQGAAYYDANPADVVFDHGVDGYAVIPNIEEGDYWLTELDPGDGSVAAIVRGDGNAQVVDAANRRVTLHVTAGVADPALDTAAVATITNNTCTMGSLRLKKRVTVNNGNPGEDHDRVDGAYLFSITASGEETPVKYVWIIIENGGMSKYNVLDPEQLRFDEDYPYWYSDADKPFSDVGEAEWITVPDLAPGSYVVKEAESGYDSEPYEDDEWGSGIWIHDERSLKGVKLESITGGTVSGNGTTVQIVAGEATDATFTNNISTKTGFTVRKAWDGWDNTDDYTVEFAVTRRATARTYDIESETWVDGAHIDEPLRFVFTNGDGLTTSRTLTISRQGKTANLTPAVSGGTGYNVSYVDGGDDWQTALDGLEKFKANSATSLTFYTYSVEEMCIRDGQGDEIYGYTTTYGLDDSVLLNNAHQYAGQLIYENASGQRTTIYGYDASNMVGASSIAYTGTPGPYVGIDEIYDGATATITNTKADNASLRLNKVVQLHTDLIGSGSMRLTNGTYAFEVTGPNNYTKYVRITAETPINGTETTYTYQTSADGNIWSASAAVPAGGVPIEALVPGVYTITEDKPVLSVTLPDGAGMYLKDIDLPDHPGNAIDIETRTATVAVGAGGQGRVDVIYTNEVGPDTVTMRKMVLDINDSSQADSFESTTEHTWEDTADYDIGDLVPYRVTVILPQAAYQAMDHYYFRIEDKMQNLLPKSWHMYAFVKSPDATVGEVGHWYQVDDYFTFAVDQELTETQNHSMPDTGRTDCVTDALHYLSVVVKMDQTTAEKGLKGVAQGKLVTAWGSDTHSNIPKAEPDLSNVSATDFDPNHIQYLQLKYYAELLSTAVIGGDPNKPGLGNANDAMLYFDTWDRVGGDYEHTGWDRNRVYTYKLRVNKKDGEAALTGANFRLYKKYKSYVVPATGSWLTATYNCGNDYWSSFDSAVLNLLDTAGFFPSGVTAQTAATNEAELTDVWVPVSGTTSTDGTSFDWNGIDDGSYCLFEITAPKGYQGLTSPIGMSVVATHEQEATVDNDPKWRSGYTNIYPDGFIGYFVGESNGVMNLGNMLANIPNTPYPGIDIFKIDGTTRDDAEKPLSGAKFKIGQWNGTNYVDYVPAGGVSAEAETNSAGRVTFPKVEPGEYRISETVLPNGYVKLVDNDIYFSVAYNAATGMHTITRYDKPADAETRRQITPTQNTMDVTFAQAHVAVEGDPEYIVSEAGETDEQPVKQPVVPAIFTVGNMPGAELPSTGGVGPALIYIVGSIFTLLAVALLLARKRTDGQKID